MSHEKILAIDDNRDNLTALQAVLRDALPGCVVLTTTSGPHGIELARCEDPDVILLDITMPGMDGFEVCRRLKGEERLQVIPVLFLTALRTDRDSRIRALKVGADGFLSKPLDEQELAAQVRAMARLKASSLLQRLQNEQLTALVAERTRELERELAERKRAEAALRASEEHYRSLAENSPDLIARFDRKCRHLYVNAAAAKAGRYAPAEYVGLTIEESGVPGPDARKWDERIATVLKTGVTMAIEDAFATPSGPRYYHTRFVPEFAPDGAVLSVQSVARDITERKLAEEAVRESERRFTYLVANTPAMIYTCRAQGDYGAVFVSDNIMPLLGYRPEEFLADPGFWRSHIHPEDQERVLAEVPKCLQGSDEYRHEYRFRRKDETYCWVHDRLRVIRDAAGRPSEMIGHMVDITERMEAEEALRSSEARFRGLFEASRDGIIIANSETAAVKYANPAMCRMLGYSSEELTSLALVDIHPKDALPRIIAEFEAHACGEKTESHDLPCLRKDGTVFSADVQAGTVLADGVMCNVGVFRDITEHKQAEAEREKLRSQLAQAQKLESVGRLAGGVAHDFNNLLMGIMNYVELCRDALPPEHPVRGYLDEIATDAQRSADIAKQLLAFARKQVIAPKVLDLNDALAGMLKMLRHLMGEDIALSWMPGTHLWPVKIDPGQLDQILANLCVNARDAIAGVGKVVIETANTTLDETYCSTHAEAAPGEYVRLTVSDSGCGMGKDVLAHMFEPFYTTKEVGKGTGLGLATVYGIVEQNHGHIEVQSEVGKGTTFSIHLPRAASQADEKSSTVTPEGLPRGTETILLAEDEKSVRVTSRLFLEALGYTVLAAETPEEALRLGGAHSGPIHLLITDVIMPGMNGPDLAAFLAGEHPKLKCLFMSGYTADVIMHRGTLGATGHFLAKPFSRHDLARKVRQVLDGE